MKSIFKTAKGVLAAAALVLLVGFTAQAQHLTVNELIALRGHSLTDVQTTLEKKGWLYHGQCGGETEKERYCFKIGDGGKGLAAMLYLIKTPEGHSIEYTVYRSNLITKIQNNVRAGAMKLLQQNPISKDVNLRVYQKDENVLVARGGISQHYYSLQVLQKPAFERLQAYH